MRWFVGALLASLPCAALAQTGPAPADPGAGKEEFFMPPTAPEEGVTAAPLPPPNPAAGPAEEADAPRQDMVPNPLREPGPAPAQGNRKPADAAQPRGQAQRGGWVQMGTATLQVLDKINARGETIVVKVGDTGKFGTLEIAVRGCYVRTPDRPADATALLAIKDRRVETQTFNGWMVKSAPFMSMLAHPIYDVRVVGCAP